MRVECPGCGTAYQVADDAASGSMRLRCRSCQTVFSPPAAGAAPPVATPAEAPPDVPVALDEVVRRVAGERPAPPSAEAPVAARGTRAPSAPPPPKPPGTARRGAPWKALLAGVLVLALLAGGVAGWRAWRRAGEIRSFLAAKVLVSFGGPEVIKQPAGLAVIPDGRIAVLDRMDHEIKLFSPAGEPAGIVGGYGIGDDRLWSPEGLAYAAGKLATLDAGNGYVKVLGLDGRPVAKYPVYSRFYLPRGLALAEDGTIAVADTGGHRLTVIPPDGSNLRDIGGPGKEKGKLDTPYSVALLPGGRIAAAEVGTHRISIFDLGGGFVRSFEYTGQDGQFAITPTVAWIRDRSLLVLADQHLRRLQVFEEDGRPVGIIGPKPGGRHLFDETGPILADAARPGELVVLTERGQVFVLGY